MNNGKIYLATSEPELQNIMYTMNSSRVPFQVIVVDDIATSPYGTTASIFLPPLQANVCIIDNGDINSFVNVYLSYLMQSPEVDQMLVILAETVIADTNVVLYAPSLSDIQNPIPWFNTFASFVGQYHGLTIFPFNPQYTGSSFNVNYISYLVDKAVRYAILTEEAKALYNSIAAHQQQVNFNSPFERIEYNGGTQ